MAGYFNHIKCCSRIESTSTSSGLEDCGGSLGASTGLSLSNFMFWVTKIEPNPLITIFVHLTVAPTLALGYQPGTNDYLSDFRMNYRSSILTNHIFSTKLTRCCLRRLLDIIRNYSAGKPTLIFCNTRNGVCNVASGHVWM